MSVTKGVGARIAQERRLKAAREARDIDQREIASVIGVTAGAVSRWENDLTVPKDDVIAKLARYFGVTPAWLRYGVVSGSATAPLVIDCPRARLGT